MSHTAIWMTRRDQVATELRELICSPMPSGGVCWSERRYSWTTPRSRCWHPAPARQQRRGSRDEPPCGSDAPRANWYRFSPDRKGQHPKDHLSEYCGWIHADGYAGFEEICRSRDIHDVACMAHVRRKLVDVHRAQGSAIADEAIRCIARLHAVEKEAQGSPPDRRVEIRQAKAAPIFEELERWLHEQLPTISGKSPLAMAIRYGLTRMPET